MTDSDREERSKRLKGRFDNDSDEDSSSNTSKTSKTSNTSKASENQDTPLKERPSVLMYLPEDVHEDLDIRFDELNAQHKREHGEPLEKNRDYYPAVVKAGLEGKDIKDVLDI